LSYGVKDRLNLRVLEGKNANRSGKQLKTKRQAKNPCCRHICMLSCLYLGRSRIEVSKFDSGCLALHHLVTKTKRIVKAIITIYII